jgi:hypothetical protein
MLEINKTPKYIQLEYIYGDYNPSPEDWVIDRLNNEGEIGISNNTFTLTAELLVDKTRLKFSEPESTLEVRPNILFNIAELKTHTFENQVDEYYEFYNEVLVRDKRILFHKDIEIDITLFIAEKNISIFKQIAVLVEGDIIIGGNAPSSIPLEEFYSLIENFPTTHEKKLYAQSRISSVLKNYFENVKDAEKSYIKYRNRKPSNKGTQLIKLFEEYEVDKYQTIYDKLSSMLDDEKNYNETTWQKEIVDILLLLYPKYITVFREVAISADGVKQKFLDYLFIDANGHVDIVEIKQPFDQAIMTRNKYRDNYIPLRELSGTVMQLEKYIYYLNRWAKIGEKKLTQKYKEELPKGFEIHITNPKGFIIMGRENNLTKAQKNDFEVVKRKYKNVIDILSYDDLLNRLKFSIEQIKRS